MSSVFGIIIISILLAYLLAADVQIIESDEFKLSRHVIPNYYDLTLVPNMYKGTFEGSLKIEITLLKRTSEISIHCKNLELVNNKDFGIRLRAHQSDRSNKTDKYGISGYNFTSSRYSQSSNIIRILFGNFCEPGEYILHFDKFHGSLENDNLEGFHFGEYENKDGDFDQFAVTQFGPSKTRNAFPCFDEPFFRAKYKISITIPKQYNCISPYVVATSREISRTDDKTVTVIFEYPVALPTYSVGFFISKLKSQKISEYSIGHIVAHCHIRLEQYKRNNYSIGVAEQIIIKMKKYLRVEFPLDVLHHVAIPDDWMYFESMGSWGFNTFRQKELLFSTKMIDKMLITISVAHKIAQQWFGNSISPEFWTWGWLTEGLATFVSYKIVHQIHPDWLVTDLLMVDTYNSMKIDFDCCIKSLRYEPKTPLEVSFKYSETAAYKGAAMLRMIEETLPKGMFLQGLARFVQQKELDTVQSKDLYNSIEKFIKMRPNIVKIPLTLSEIMLNWEENPGYPVVEVARNSHNEEEITITQKSYGDKNSKSIWYIPINYSIKKPKTFNNIEPTDWLISETKQITVKFLTRNSWILLNNKGFYYYRIKYDSRNWKLIEQQLLKDHEEIHYLNRMQLISDSFSLADNGWLEYYVPLDLIKYIQHETRYAPLKALKDASDTLNHRLCGTYIKDTFKTAISNSLKVIIDNLQKQIFREDLMVLDYVSSWLCELDPEQCNKHRNNPGSGKFEKNVWCDFIRKDANENQWNDLFKEYQSSTFDSDKFEALACAENSRLLIKFLKYVMSYDKHRLFTALKSIIFSNQNIGVNVVLKFVISHFDKLLPILSDEELADIFALVGARLTTEEDLLPLTRFARKHASYDYLTEPSIRKARENVKWRDSNLKAVEKYFSDNKPSGSAHEISFNVVTLFLNHMLFYNFISK